MKKETSIIFTGDIGFDRYFDQKWKDEELLSKEIYDYFATADHVVANVEGALCDIDPASDPGGKGIFCHMMSPEAVDVFDKMHADIYNFANNHTMDAGRPGIEQALALTKKKGIATVGCGMNIEDAAKPHYIEEAGGIGIIGVGYQPTCVPATETEPGNFPWNDYERIGKALQEIKKEHKWAVIIVHGGEEFESMPMPHIREHHLKYCELGADVVVGHHPHVPQNYEILPDGKLIFYSLGNFIFDTDYQRAQINTDRGVLLKLFFTEDKVTFEGFGTKLLRGPEHVVAGELPDIFTEISAEDYERLIPLGAKAFVHAEKARRSFLHPDRYANATEEDWADYFAGNRELKRSRPDLMNFDITLAEAAKEPEGAWKDTKYEKIANYLLREFEDR